MTKKKAPAAKKTKTIKTAAKTAKSKTTAKRAKVTSSKKTKPKKDAVQAIVDAVVLGMEEKKAKEITVLDLRKTGNSVADFFVVCHGDSRVQVDAIANSVMDEVEKKLNEKLKSKEGKQNSEWIILDYFNVVAHIFIKEKREFYSIEKLWADAEVYSIAANQ